MLIFITDCNRILSDWRVQSVNCAVGVSDRAFSLHLVVRGDKLSAICSGYLSQNFQLIPIVAALEIASA